MQLKHPVYNTIELFLEFFNKYNFIYQNSDIITDYEDNFHFLECDANHTALSIKDTFILNNNKNILRTHTTSFQKIFFKKYKDLINNNVAINALNYGLVFRKDDSSKHSYFFHQIDGLMCNSNLCIRDLIYILTDAIKTVIGKSLEFRVRSSYFPFTDPSFEIDIVNNNNYIEVLGCGFVCKKILSKCNLKVENIFAFGIGIERIASIKFNILNIKKLRLS